jgi:hypothetical protein
MNVTVLITRFKFWSLPYHAGAGGAWFGGYCLRTDATRATAAAYSSGVRAPLLYLRTNRVGTDSGVDIFLDEVQLPRRAGDGKEIARERRMRTPNVERAPAPFCILLMLSGGSRRARAVHLGRA